MKKATDFLIDKFWSLFILLERPWIKSEYRKELKQGKTNKTWKEYLYGEHYRKNNNKIPFEMARLIICSIPANLYIISIIAFCLFSFMQKNQYGVEQFDLYLDKTTFTQRFLDIFGWSGIFHIIIFFAIANVFFSLTKKTFNVYQDKVYKMYSKHKNIQAA